MNRLLERALHRIAHWLHWNYGTVECWHNEDGILKVGFRCSYCGELSGVETANIEGER